MSGTGGTLRTVNWGAVRIYAAALLLALTLAGAAEGATQVVGTEPGTETEPMAILPDLSRPADQTLTNTSDGGVAFIQSMPTTKRVKAVSVGELAVSDACPAARPLTLEVFHHPYRALRPPRIAISAPAVTKVAESVAPAIVARGRWYTPTWAFERAVTLSEDEAYSFRVTVGNPVVPPTGGDDQWPAECYTPILQRKRWAHSPLPASSPYRTTHGLFAVNSGDYWCEETTTGPIALLEYRFFAFYDADPGWGDSDEDEATAQMLCRQPNLYAGPSMSPPPAGAQIPDNQAFGWLTAHATVSDPTATKVGESMAAALLKPTPQDALNALPLEVCRDDSAGVLTDMVNGSAVKAVPGRTEADTLYNAYEWHRCPQSIYAPPGIEVPDGWYYALPFGVESSYVPHDAALALWPTVPETAISDPRELYGLFDPANPNEPRCFHGDPVNCATGNLATTESDLEIPGRGVDLKVTRTYNAQAAALGFGGMFGRGWTSVFDSRVDKATPDGDVVTVTHDGGSTATFRWNGSAFEGVRQLRSKLERRADGSYRYELPNDEVYEYAVTGELQRISDPNGNVVTLTWSGGRLRGVAGGGRRLAFGYNETTNEMSIGDTEGRFITYSFSGRDLVRVRYPGALLARYTYDSLGRMLTHTDVRGTLVLTNTYDSQSRVVRQEDARGKPTLYEYSTNDASSKTKVTDRDGRVTMNRFTNGLLMSRTVGLGSTDAATTYFDYDGRRQPTGATDAAGRETRFRYDGDGNLISTTDPLGNRTATEYNAAGLPTRIETPAGRVTENRYDSRLNLVGTTSTGPQGGRLETTRTYDQYGQLLTVTNEGNQRRTTYTYDAVGNVTREQTASGRITSYTYNRYGAVLTTTLPAGNAPGGSLAANTITYTRDWQGRPLTVKDQLGAVTTNSYDPLGRLLSTTDPESRVVSRTYDDEGRVLTLRRGDGVTDRWSYTDEGLLASYTNGNGQVTTYQYDGVGREIGKVDPLGRRNSLRYTAGGEVSAAVDSGGAEVRFSYDAAGRMTRQSNLYNSQDTTTFEYDGDGLLTRAQTGTSATNVLTVDHDALGRETRRAYGNGQNTTFDWDAGGDLVGVGYPMGTERPSGASADLTESFGKVTYEYDDDGLMTVARDWSGRTFSFEYDQNRWLTGVNYPVGRATLAYDRVGRIQSVTTPVGRRDYTMSSAGVQTGIGFDGAAATPITVDGALHLTQYGTSTATFDAAEQPTQLTSPTGAPVTQTFDAAGQMLTRATGGTTTNVTYDASGRRRYEKVGSTTTTIYSYDGYGRLFGLNGKLRNGTSRVTVFRYGPDGTRRSRTISGSVTDEVWTDVIGAPSALLTQGRNAYVYGPAGMVLERVKSGNSPTFLWQDGLGSVIGATDASGAVAARYTYTPWGERTSGDDSVAGVLGFAGQVTEPGMDIQYLQARWYDPKSAQFLTRDPQETLTRQPYLYASGNPAMFTDPTGESILDKLEAFGKGALKAASWGLADAGPIDPCSFWGFAGEQIGGQLDPRRKAKAVGTLGGLGFASRAARGGESSAARYGRMRHTTFDYGPGFEPEFRLPSGKRADAVDQKRRIVVELKPNDPKAIAQGWRQALRYAAELEKKTGKPFTPVVYTYERP